MAICIFRPDELLASAGKTSPVPVPLGDPVSLVTSAALLPGDAASTKVGVWHCTPGQWRRQVVQAEFCHFLSGECTFTPDGGEPVEVRAGDVLFFPANSLGVWYVRAASSKIFMVFDEAAGR